jgi:hypothetical protein
VKKLGSCVALHPFVNTAYAQVRLVPLDLRALPAELFTPPLFSAFYEFVSI